MKTPARVSLVILVLNIGLLAMFPPWVFTYNRAASSYAGHSRTPGVHQFILNPPKPASAPNYAGRGDEYWGVEIDVARLLLEIVIAAAIAAACWFTLRHGFHLVRIDRHLEKSGQLVSFLVISLGGLWLVIVIIFLTFTTSGGSKSGYEVLETKTKARRPWPDFSPRPAPLFTADDFTEAATNTPPPSP